MAEMTDTELINGLHDWHTYLGSYDKGPLIEQSAERIAQLAADNTRLAELVRRKDEATREILKAWHNEPAYELIVMIKNLLALTEPQP